MWNRIFQRDSTSTEDSKLHARKYTAPRCSSTLGNVRACVQHRRKDDSRRAPISGLRKDGQHTVVFRSCVQESLRWNSLNSATMACETRRAAELPSERDAP